MTIYEYLGFSKEYLQSIDIPKNYLTFMIKKKDGKTNRRIDAPTEGLKEVQKAILYKILYKIRPHDIAHGFVVGRSPKTNAEQHVGRRVIVKTDIKDFFPSIHIYRVQQILHRILKDRKEFDPVNDEDVELLSNILCLRDSLPQGAPSSPAMTNIVCLGMDSMLEALKDNPKYKDGLTITRYADDITISFDSKNISIGDLILEILSILHRCGFKINTKKVSVRHNNMRQKVTGVVVNTKLNTQKTSWKNLRAEIHQAAFLPPAERNLMKIRGKLEWLRSLNPLHGNQLLEKFNRIATAKP